MVRPFCYCVLGVKDALHLNSCCFDLAGYLLLKGKGILFLIDEVFNVFLSCSFRAN